VNSDSQIGHSLRWVFGGCFGLVLACLLVPLVGAYAAGYILDALRIVLKLWVIGAGIVLSWGWYRGVKLIMSVSLDSDDNDEGHKE